MTTNEDCPQDTSIENNENIIIKKDDKIMKTTTNVKCEELIEEIYKGNYLLLPMFAQYLISFLNEDMPESDDPRILGQHIATKGMYMMKKAHELGTKDNETDNVKNIEDNMIVLRRKIAHDIFFMFFGVMVYTKSNSFSLICILICCKIFDHYKLLYQKNTKMFDFIWIVTFAYQWCS